MQQQISAEALLLDRLGDVKFVDCPHQFSRHLVGPLSQHFSLSGVTLVTWSLLFGDGRPLQNLGIWTPCSNAATSLVVSRWHAPGSLAWERCGVCRGWCRPPKADSDHGSESDAGEEHSEEEYSEEEYSGEEYSGEEHSEEELALGGFDYEGMQCIECMAVE